MEDISNALSLILKKYGITQSFTEFDFEKILPAETKGRDYILELISHSKEWVLFK